MNQQEKGLGELLRGMIRDRQKDFFYGVKVLKDESAKQSFCPHCGFKPSNSDNVTQSIHERVMVISLPDSSLLF